MIGTFMKKDNVSKTAEMVALIRSETEQDKNSRIFVSKETYNKYWLIKKTLPAKKINELFLKRVALSGQIDKSISKYRPEQVIEIGCGYSLRGYYLTKKNKKLVWIDTDFPSLIERKKEIMAKNFPALPKNYHLISADILSDSIHEKTSKYLNSNKRTLVITEGLISYLTNEEFEILINNLKELLIKLGNGAFLSHEIPIKSGKQITSGSIGSLLRKYITLITKRKSHRHFNSEKDLVQYFRKKGFSKTRVLNKPNFIFLAES